MNPARPARSLFGIRRHSITVLAAALLGGVAFAASGCGGNGGSTTRGTDTAQGPPPAGQAAPGLLTAKNCRQVIDLPLAFTDVLTGLEDHLARTVALTKTFAVRSPLDVRADFQTLAAASAKVSTTLKGDDLTSATTPSAPVIAKLRKLLAEIDTTRVTEAAANVSAWAQKNCSAAGG